MLFLVACTSRILLSEHTSIESAGPSDTDLEEAPGETGERGDTADTAESRGADIFDTSLVHSIAFTISADGVGQLGLWPCPYVVTTMVFDGEEFGDVGVRVKGRYGSYRTMPSKIGMKIDMREFSPGQEIHGIEKFNLNNMVQDCAKTHEFAAYGIHRLLGQPAPRVTYAEVTINGESYGLYAVVEEYDDEFLTDHFSDPSGNLYDGDYFLYPDWSSYILVDFNESSQELFQLDAGTDVALADIRAITAANAQSGTFADVFGSLVDEDQHAAFFALAAWTGHSDSYSYYSNNYRVYFDPARGGRAVFLPWDPDWAFYSSTNVTGPYGILSQRCFADYECRTLLSGYIDRLNVEVPGSALQDEVEAMISLIQEPLLNDPKLESSHRDIAVCQADQIDWFSRRREELDSWGM